MIENEIMYTEAELAKTLGVSAKTLQKNRYNKKLPIGDKIPYVKICGSVRYIESDIMDFIDRKRMGQVQKAAIVDEDEKGQPVIASTYVRSDPDGHRVVAFRCPFCGKIHEHGGGWGFGEGDGWRTPHCGKPTVGTYLIQEVDDKGLAGDLEYDPDSSYIKS